MRNIKETRAAVQILWASNRFSLANIEAGLGIRLTFAGPWMCAATLHKWIVTGNFAVSLA